MSVVEFSADSWQASAPGLQKGLANRIEALTQLAQGLESLAGSENISGQGADAMRAYIGEVHLPIVQSFIVGLYTFQTAIGVYWSGYSEVDTDGNFRLVNDEFDSHTTNLTEGVELLRGFAADLRTIAQAASHLVSLDGAGANAADTTADALDRMLLIAKTQKETWEAYEGTDHGFGQVKTLLAELGNAVKNVGSLTVGQGRSYTPGSFDLTLTTLGELTGTMLEYCETNQQVASDGWDALFAGYVDDVNAEEERKQKEQAFWGMLWDGLQIAAGVVVTAIGVGLTPFTAGFSLGLTVLGGSMIIGGANSMVNHVSIATTGEGLNLIGMASDHVGEWYDVTVAQPAADSGSPGAQFLAGLGSGVGQVLSGTLQFNVQETAQGLAGLAFDENVRNEVWNQLTTMVDQVKSGDTFVMGQIAGNLIPFGAATKFGKPGALMTKADNLLPSFKPLSFTTPKSTTPAFDWIKDKLGKPGKPDITVRDDFDPVVVPDKIDVPAARPQAIDIPGENPRNKVNVLDPFTPGSPRSLLPNVRYRASAPGTNHNYIYETNDRGLIDRVDVDVLHLKPQGRPRLNNDRDTPGKLPGDEAGHLVGDLFDGDPKLRNLISQIRALNRGAGSEWTRMERKWETALKAKPGSVTDVKFEIVYGSSKRPVGIAVEYKIDGKVFAPYFPNPPMK